MSHWDGKESWEIRRDGERAFERGDGRFRNPYEEQKFSYEGGIARDDWNRGYRNAELRAEERRQQEEAERQELLRRERRQEEENAWEREQMTRQALYGGPPEDGPLEPEPDPEGAEE